MHLLSFECRTPVGLFANRFYEPSILDQEEEQVLPFVEDLEPNSHVELTKDTILQNRSKTIREGA